MLYGSDYDHLVLMKNSCVAQSFIDIGVDEHKQWWASLRIQLCVARAFCEHLVLIAINVECVSGLL